MIQETMLMMSRMSCNGCVRNITRALQTLPTIEVIATDLPTKIVHLQYDNEQVTTDVIKATLSAAKYPVASEQIVGHADEEVSPVH